MSDRVPLLASRRAVLATGAVSIAAVAGCSTLTADSSTLDIALFNHTDAPYTVELGLFRVDSERSRSDARAYSESIAVEPGGETQREAVVESRQYVVRYELFEDNRTPADEGHVHFYPEDDGGDGIAFDIHSPGVVTRR